MVWRDAGSNNKLDYTAWVPIPSPDYVALGCVLRFGKNNREKPQG